MSRIIDPDTSLSLTVLPWHARQDADGEWLKVPSLPAGFHYEDFEYGRPVVPLDQWGWGGWDRWGQRIPQDDQPGYVTSYRSGVIVVDHDSADFAAWLESIGVRLPPTTEVSTGRRGGRHQIFDGRHLTRDQWPRQRNYLGLGDIRSHGFCAAPTAVHPSGRRYELVRPMQPALWDPEWTRLLDEAWAAMGRGTGDSYERTEGSGRNCELISLKGALFAQGYDEDDPELVRMILERNASFSVPLSEDEVAATILRYKGWTRRQVPGVVPGTGRERLGDAELQEYKARMAEAFGRTEGTQGGSAGQEAASAATPPLTSADHLSTAVPEGRKEDGRQVIAAAQEVSSRVRKALRRRKKHLQAIDPQTLWPSRVDAAATTKALHNYVLDLGIEQGSHLITWVAEKAAAAMGVGIATVNRHLRRLEHHGQLRRGAEGQLIVSLSPKSLRPRQKKAGETIGKDEAIALVRKEMQAAVTGPRRISQRELLESTQSQIGGAHFEACMAQGRITPAPPRMTIYRVRQALGVLQENGEFTKIAPALPEEKSPGVWRSDPSAWAPGRIPVPQQPKRMRFGSMKRAYMAMASCRPCTPRDMREAA